MPLTSLPHDEYCEMLRPVMKNTLEFFKDKNENLYNLSIKLNEKGDDFLTKSDKYEVNHLESDTLKDQVTEKKAQIKKAIDYFISDVKSLLRDDYSVIISSMGLTTTGSSLNQSEFNKFIAHALQQGKLEVEKNEKLLTAFQEFEKHAIDFLDTDNRFEYNKINKKNLRLDRENARKESDRVLKKMISDIEYEYGEKSKEIFIRLGFKFYRKKRDKNDEVVSDNEVRDIVLDDKDDKNNE